MRIDAHQHFWRLSRGDYGWLNPAAGPLFRDYEPGHLAPLLEQAGVGATVLVQAAPTEAEKAEKENAAALNAEIAARKKVLSHLFALLEAKRLDLDEAERRYRDLTR